MGSVTSGCFEDPTAAVHHGARHDKGVKPQFIAGEHCFQAHGGRLLVQLARGIQTWDREGREGEKARGESSAALLLLDSLLPWGLGTEGKEKAVTPLAEPWDAAQIRGKMLLLSPAAKATQEPGSGDSSAGWSQRRALPSKLCPSQGSEMLQDASCPGRSSSSLSLLSSLTGGCRTEPKMPMLEGTRCDVPSPILLGFCPTSSSRVAPKAPTAPGREL